MTILSWIKTLILSQIPLLARFLFKMSSQPDSQGLSDPESDSLSSDSEAEIRNCGSNCSQGPQDRPKPVRCWKFRDFVQAEVSDDSSKLRLIEFIRTRLTHNRPACVRSVTVFADLNQYLSAVSDETPTVSIAIVGYIQTKPSRKTTMKSWLSSAAWDPVSGGLYSDLVPFPLWQPGLSTGCGAGNGARRRWRRRLFAPVPLPPRQPGQWGAMASHRNRNGSNHV